MSNPVRRGQSGNPVSTSMQGDTYTPFANTSAINPYGLQLRQTITSSGSVVIPDGINWVYVILAGGGGGGLSSTTAGTRGGGAGGIAWGWTLAQNTCIIGAGSPGASTPTRGGYTRYGNVIAGGGGGGSVTPNLGGAGSGAIAGSTNKIQELAQVEMVETVLVLTELFIQEELDQLAQVPMAQAEVALVLVVTVTMLQEQQVALVV